jgi:hypothetical protein
MTCTTARTTSALAIAGVLALSACGGGGSGAAAKGGSATNGRTPSPSSPAPAGSPSGSNPAAGTLTAAQITKALPKAADLPKGWKVDTTSTMTSNMTSKDSAGVTPTSCSAASQVQENFNFVATESAHGNIDFVGPQQTTFSGTTVYSYAAPYPASAFAAIRAAVTKCPSYSETEDDGSKVPDHVSMLSVPAMGDEALALEVTSVYQNLTLDLVIVLVRSGSTLVAVEDAGAGTPASAARAEKLAATTLGRVTSA